MTEPTGVVVMTDDEHRALAEQLLGRWKWGKGESKSSLEQEIWDDPSSHGQRFSAYIRNWLGIETVRKSPQARQLARAEALLRCHGILLLVSASLMVGCSDSGPTSPPGAAVEAHVDGPVIVSGLTQDSDHEDAEVVGAIMLERACIELHSTDGQIYGVAWPEGTTWDEGNRDVVLSDGRRAGNGDSIRGAGGYYGILDDLNLGSTIAAAAQGCGHGTVVLLNGNVEDVDID